ncbi:MAG: hypothetical protein ACREJP_01295, partial [Candidatus Methylomirabilales bacterium]
MRVRIPRTIGPLLAAVVLASGILVWHQGAPFGPGRPAAAEDFPGYAPPVLLGNIEDPAVVESSGLVASRRDPGLL